MRGHSILDALRKNHAIDSERAATGNARFISRIQHDAAEQPHLGFQQSVRVQGIRRFERVTADQLGESIGLMRRRHPDGPHLVQPDAYTSFGERPGSLASGETTTHDRYYGATSSGSGAVSSTIIVCPHLRHLRVVSPVVFDFSSSMPTKLQLGHGTATGLFQVE